MRSDASGGWRINNLNAGSEGSWDHISAPELLLRHEVDLFLSLTTALLSRLRT